MSCMVTVVRCASTGLSMLSCMSCLTGYYRTFPTKFPMGWHMSNEFQLFTRSSCEWIFSWSDEQLTLASPDPSFIGPRSRVLVSTVVLFVSQIFRPRRSYYLFPYRRHIRPTISSTELHLHKLEKAMYNACQTYVQICQSTAFFWIEGL